MTSKAELQRNANRAAWLDLMLREVLACHRHDYDADCDRDFGCDCAAKDSHDWRSPNVAASHAGYADHLHAEIMAVVRKAFTPRA